MVKTPIFKGACTAIVTPFTQEGVDYEQLRKNIDFQYENGSAAIVVCGTTGEAVTQSQCEQYETIRQAIQHNRGRMKVIVGIGGNNTQTALRNAENAKSAGADGVLMVTPYYNKSTQKGLIEHFSYVAERVDIPMILYNVPSRTGLDIPVSVYQRLSRIPNIAGVKEANPDINKIARIRNACGEDFPIWSGNDDLIVPTMALGGKGVISVLSNIKPEETAEMCDAALNGDFETAAELQCQLLPLIDFLFCEVNPIPVKAVMQHIGYDCGACRLPLCGLSSDKFEKLASVLP